MQLQREDLIEGLSELVRQARDHGLTGISIRIVGGAALRLAYFDRATTTDIDAQIEPLGPLIPFIEEVARNRGWPVDWLNDKAVMFIPSWGKKVNWEQVFDDADVSIAIAPIDALLAMKLNAARAGRDTDDIAKLLALNDIHSIEAAEDLFEAFYPGDGLSNRTLGLLDRILALGLPEKPQPPPFPDFS